MGCSAGHRPAPAAAPAPSPAPPPACPSPGGAAYTWPAGFPLDLPRPPGTRLLRTRTAPPHLHIAELAGGGTLRDAIGFLDRALPAAGYALGEGDAERAEADQPFHRGTALQGTIRVAEVRPCATNWLVAVSGTATGTPRLPRSGTPMPTSRPLG